MFINQGDITLKALLKPTVIDVHELPFLLRLAVYMVVLTGYQIILHRVVDVPAVKYTDNDLGLRDAPKLSSNFTEDIVLFL